jgi:AraC-like DNA-binding protein
MLGPHSIIFYHAVGEKLSAWRLPSDRHQFLTLEFSKDFLARHLAGHEAALHPLIRRILAGQTDGPCVCAPLPLASALRKKLAALQDPPVKAAAAPVWYQGQALSLMADLFFQAESVSASPSRQLALARQRVEKAIEILGQRLANPPTLEELGREVGCSQFYLSRTFSRQMSMTIPQYLRQIRMERAAELLKSGRFNVTEAALEVGYSSISHFSHAFYETMGCCPGLYPLGVIMPGGRNVPTPVQATDKK